MKFKWNIAELFCGKTKSVDMKLFDQIYTEIRMCGYQNEIDLIESIQTALNPNTFNKDLFNEY